MRVSTTLVVLAGFLHQILAAPSLAETDKRGTFTPPMLARIYIQFDDGAALQNRCNGAWTTLLSLMLENHSLIGVPWICQVLPCKRRGYLFDYYKSTSIV